MSEIIRFYGTKIFVTETATIHDGYNFPSAKNRSSRVFKKLLKKFGSYERRKPAIFEIKGVGIHMHPILFEQMKEKINDKRTD